MHQAIQHSAPARPYERRQDIPPVELPLPPSLHPDERHRDALVIT